MEIHGSIRFCMDQYITIIENYFLAWRLQYFAVLQQCKDLPFVEHKLPKL